MEQNNKPAANTTMPTAADCKTPLVRTVMDAADELRKDWQLKGTGPYADPTALGKLKALAEAAKDNEWLRRMEFEPAASPAAILSLIALVSQQAARIAELVSGLSAAREMVSHPDNVAVIDRALAGATKEGK